KVNFKGSVTPDKVFHTLRSYHLFILPTLGENFGHAIFEALSTGCPVLISNRTPWNDIETEKAGWTLPIEDMDGFIQVMEKLAQMDESRFNELSLSAYHYAHTFMDKRKYREYYINLFS